MTTVKTITPLRGDPLGYEGDVLTKLRGMAQDALAGANEDAVEEEAAVLRNRLGLNGRGQQSGRDQGQ